ncbi:family 20 glycosylhydrolase [Pararcticibacter amylolyticus]|uniref:beta-N-acetylhexosaminidase n=1 Tax=Pararcticibacter amylolyticus TaxID=2173175 RepID=A0A2U2PJ86_9SPHI|nr:family 20 glycosylhydrolase [Pararcticibacter amylolyticus]PWG81466.1 hypothetical protein DDR33_06440 [Pararcticibacter amylolyticus]
MILIRSLFILIVLLVTETVTAAGQSSVSIVPLPVHVRKNGKNFPLRSGADYEQYLFANEHPAFKGLYTGIRNQDPVFDKLCRRLGLLKQDTGKEGYELLIDNERIVLVANTAQGLFYGKQSLKQLLRSARNNRLEGMHIIDTPALKYRGVMDDISRGPVPSKEYMKYQIRRMSELKLNMLCYYTEHIVLTKKHPEFAPPAAGISIDEWKEIEAYAKAHYIELVPNFQSLGHAEKVLQNPKYRHLAESNTMYSPVKAETIQFMNDIYDEMCPAFGSSFFHVNCDETFDLGRGPSKKLADSIGAGKVYANYVNQLADILRRNNKRMMMWGDVALQHPEIISLLPRDAVMMTWEYGDKASFSSWIDPFVSSRLDYMVCTGVLNSLRLFPDYGQAIPNIRNFTREGAQKGAMGVLNTVWDDGGLHSFDRDWYGVAYGAEHSWNPNSRDLSDFDKRLSAGIYRGEGMALFNAIHLLTEMAAIPVLENMNELVFWKTIIPERGKTVSYSVSGWEEVHEMCLRVDSSLKSGKPVYYSREYAALQFVSDEYKYLSQARLKLAEASEFYSDACRLQKDNRAEAQRVLEKARTNIINCQAAFKILKKDFEYIWNQENRPYWIDFATDPFNKVAGDYEDLIKSFDRSAEYFSRHLPLSAPTDIRLDISPLAGDYFTYWLISPPFSSGTGNNFNSDYLKRMGGERNAAPFPGFSFSDESGKNIKWMKYSSPLSDIVPLNEALDSKKQSVAYAFCTIEAPSDMSVTVNLGACRDIELICNGLSVFKKQGNKSMLVDEFECGLNLKAGKNRILVKTQGDIDGWGFSFRIKDQKISSSKNRYRLVSKS